MAAPVGPKKVHRYTVEFKIQAVRLSLHPEIQTQDVARCERVKHWLMNRVAVHIEGFDRRLLFKGVVGERILGAWKETA